MNLSVGQVAGPLHQLSLLRRIVESRDLDGVLSGEGAQFILKYLGLIKRYFPGEDTNLSVLRALL